jgi:hypothetical protein
MNIKEKIILSFIGLSLSMFFGVSVLGAYKYNPYTKKPDYYENGTGPGGSGTVTSVSLAVPTGLQVSGSPVTTSGTITVSLASGYIIPTATDISQGTQAYWNASNSPYSLGLGGTTAIESQATTSVTVCPSDCMFADLQEAIDYATSTEINDVWVKSGTTTITAQIIGASDLVLHGDGFGSVITQADGTNLGNYMLYFASTTNFVIRDLKIDCNGANNTGNHNGIGALSSTDFEIRHNYIKDCYSSTYNPASIAASYSGGIPGTRGVITDNIIENPDFGIYAHGYYSGQASSTYLIRNNIVRGTVNNNAFYLSGVKDFSFIGNTGPSLDVQGCTRGEIVGNALGHTTNNEPPMNLGQSHPDSFLNISSNDLTDTESSGIGIFDLASSTISGNHISGNTHYGIELIRDTINGNSFYGNTMYNNTLGNFSSDPGTNNSIWGNHYANTSFDFQADSIYSSGGFYLDSDDVINFNSTDDSWTAKRESYPTGSVIATTGAMVLGVYGAVDQGLMVRDHANNSLMEVDGEGYLYSMGGLLLPNGKGINFNYTDNYWRMLKYNNPTGAQVATSVALTIDTYGVQGQGFMIRNHANTSLFEVGSLGTVFVNGSLGIGTTSPWKKFSVSGDAVFTGRLYDSTASSGSWGSVLTSGANGLEWKATSSLGISGGPAGSQTPWGSAIDGAGYPLINVSKIGINDTSFYPTEILGVATSVDSYAQAVFRNSSYGTNASMDLILENASSTDTGMYLDIGINGPNYSNPAYSITGPHDSYIYNTGGNLTVGTASSTKSLIFHTGGTIASNTRMLIDPYGNIGIGYGTSTTSYLNFGSQLGSQGYGMMSASGTIMLSSAKQPYASSTYWSSPLEPDVLPGASVANFMATYSDDPGRILVMGTTTNGMISLKKGNVSANNTLANAAYAGIVLQQINTNTLRATSTASTRGAVTYKGFHYVMTVCTSSRDIRSIKINVATSSWSNNIATFANWGTSTLIGYTPTLAVFGLVGAANDMLYVASNSQTLIPLAIDSVNKTLTAQTPITISGAYMNQGNTRVNENGIYAGFSSAPYVRKHYFTGVINNSSGQIYAGAPSTTGPDFFALKYSVYGHVQSAATVVPGFIYKIYNY